MSANQLVVVIVMHAGQAPSHVIGLRITVRQFDEVQIFPHGLIRKWLTFHAPTPDKVFWKTNLTKLALLQFAFDFVERHEHLF